MDSSPSAFGVIGRGQQIRRNVTIDSYTQGEVAGVRKARKNRLVMTSMVTVGVAVAVAFGLMAFRENLFYFFSPSQVVAGEAPMSRPFRIGGMVEADSVEREPGSLTVRFVVTDFVNSVSVSYTGLLPDLFGEEQGVVAQGRLDGNGEFLASEVLAKHDENYMPIDISGASQKALQ